MREDNSLMKLNNNELLKKPGDSLELRITKTGRRVAKIHTSDLKGSLTQYPNGTMVETRSNKTK